MITLLCFLLGLVAGLLIRARQVQALRRRTPLLLVDRRRQAVDLHRAMVAAGWHEYRADCTLYDQRLN